MPTLPPRRLAASLAVGFVVVGLAGCGGSDIETSEIEQTISKQFAAQGVQLTEVSCKGGVQAEKDAPVSCTGLNPSGTTLVLEGKITAIKDGKASFRVRAVRGIAKGPVVASQALALVRKQIGSKATSLTCPAEVPLPTKPSVVCALKKADGKTYDVTTTIGADSQVRLRVATTPR